MTRNFLLSLSDIVDNMEKAQQLLGDMSCDEFVSNEMACYAVVPCIEIIAEAAKSIPSDIRAKRPEVSWNDLAGLRDKCIHTNLAIDHRRIWQAIKEDISNYQLPIRTLIDELRWPGQL
jgi:uncharacterized protein with HEPN domain